MNEKELTGLLESWENLPLLISQLSEQPEEAGMLMNIALYSDHDKSWRAAWIADKINDTNPELITPFLGKMINQLKKETNPGKKRQFLKLISLNKIPKKHFSFLADYCFKCFTSANEPVGVKVHALQILFNLSEKEADLKSELLSLIEYELELNPMAGVKARGKKLAGILRKQISNSGS
ncbi:MAG: hypothetical protein PHN68_03600 [Prolixibacteraceae bacterium]|jgi:hypothetical protein|nr:hypothetical protein [Prolixibacteraceae bacterium]MDD4756284.1 hypothetical protein [Prolixibacteraceae bacterium]NLO02193.1 hypothetical protein [Bacteroidales bacterium]